MSDYRDPVCATEWVIALRCIDQDGSSYPGRWLTWPCSDPSIAHLALGSYRARFGDAALFCIETCLDDGGLK